MAESKIPSKGFKIGTMTCNGNGTTNAIYYNIPIIDGYKPVGIVGVGSSGDTAVISKCFVRRINPYNANQVVIAYDPAVPSNVGVMLDILYLKL